MYSILLHILILGVSVNGQHTEKQWKVATPAVAPYFYVDSISNESAGLMLQLFDQTLPLKFGRFTILPISTWFREKPREAAYNLTSFEVGALNCVTQMTQSNSTLDLCLAQMTTASMNALDNLYPPRLVPMWMELKPVLMAACIGQRCPRRSSPAVLQSLYFLRPFHSSVWSLLLLCILTVTSALFVFERTHLCQVGKHSQGSNNRKGFSFLDSLLLTLLGLLLQSYHKFPRSWAGVLLLLFWHAFSLVTVIAYAFASAKLIFQPPLEFEEYATTLHISPRSYVSCEPNSVWCDVLRSKSNLQVTELDLPRDEFGQLSVTELNESLPLMIDHLTAAFLANYGSREVHNGSSGLIQWFPAQLECSDEVNLTYIPPIPLSFIARTEVAAWRMNRHLQQLKQSGELDEIFNRWQHLPKAAYSLCRSRTELTVSTPVRLQQMNGPYLFILIGAILACIAHIAELFYRFVIQSRMYPTRDEQSGPEAALLQ